ncbi:MAG: porin family protein [Bacteroidales bacterium]|nr:porin family protein [Bacteroidales bacterium]
MKKILLVLIAVALSAGAFAQFSWGLKAGASSNTFKMDPLTATAGTALAAAEEAAWGFHGGAFVRISMLGLMVQPELLFSMAENNIMVEDAGVETIKSQKFSKLDIPVMLGIKLGPARIMAGPAASVMLSSTDEISDVEDLAKRATFGYQAGLGVDLLGKLTLDVRYEGGLNSFGNEIEIAGETLNLDGRANAIILSVGIMF